jgi:hypothetical protein
MPPSANFKCDRFAFLLKRMTAPIRQSIQLKTHLIYTGILTAFLGMAIAISQVRRFIVFVLFFLAFWIKLAWRNSGCAPSSTKRMPPMLIRPLRWVYLL